jgi:hypothetical protein
MRLAIRGGHVGKYSTSGEYPTHMGIFAVKSECESQFFSKSQTGVRRIRTSPEPSRFFIPNDPPAYVGSKGT